MSLKAQDRTKDLLRPYRQKIDAIDRQIIELLKQRYDVIREVGILKAAQGIDPFINERIDEVRENAARLASQRGLDEDFIRHIYAQLIKHSCELEESIKQSLDRQKKKSAAQ